MHKKEFCVLMKQYFLMKKVLLIPKKWLDECYQGSEPSEATIPDTLKISQERVGHIIHEYLGMRKLCAKWVSRELTIEQNQERVDASEQCLQLFNRN
ncbi:unnamed protein product [Euphydryas editha]|uniref:Uncharacterized protein n=1 Tax=Euphydryas editha TaxID=104508 RepID=A0AAU9UGU9_EUPED|nr:unnamed protein product [Euphydryas editha]